MSIHIKSQKGFERHQNRTLQKKEERKNKFNISQAEALSSHLEISSLRAELAEVSSSYAKISSLRAELAAEVSKDTSLLIIVINFDKKTIGSLLQIDIINPSSIVYNVTSNI